MAIQHHAVATVVHTPATVAFDCRIVGKNEPIQQVVGRTAVCRETKRAVVANTLARNCHIVPKELRRSGELQPERRAALDRNGRTGADGTCILDGERTGFDDDRTRKARCRHRQLHLARTSLHEPRVVADGGAVRVGFSRISRHNEIRAVSPRASSECRGRHRRRADYQ